MSKILSVTILLALVISISSLTSVYADSSFYKFGDKPTFSYLPSYPHLPFKTPLNWSIDVMAPDGSCNIKGTINNNDGTCTAPSIILSDNDFTTFKNGIAVLAVVHIQQVAMPAQNYCPVAQWVWTTQDDTFRNKYPENLVVPSSCGVVVPEFGPIAALVMAIAIMSIIVIASKTGLRFSK